MKNIVLTDPWATERASVLDGDAYGRQGIDPLAAALEAVGLEALLKGTAAEAATEAGDGITGHETGEEADADGEAAGKPAAREPERRASPAARYAHGSFNLQGRDLARAADAWNGRGRAGQNSQARRLPNLHQTIGLLKGLLVTSPAAADAALGKIGAAREQVSTARAGVGAQLSVAQHRLRAEASAAEQAEASLSRAMDADMAKEMTHYTRAQLLSQSTQAVLAHINTDAMRTLELLRPAMPT